jgi:nanoRNase/pAp phosphatase (c-di-AMP/oligoRNAs hydrolase)
MKIELDEAPDGSQEIFEGKLYVMCDCNYNDRCPQKENWKNRCIIRIDASRLTKKEIARLRKPQR